MNHTGVERIGKKYQWLALYELGARLADNCAFLGDRDGDPSPVRYDGESFGSLRDLDPSLLLSGTQDDGWTNFEGPCWWTPICPDLRALSPDERLHWLYSEVDLIDSDTCIDVIDPTGQRWLVMSGGISVWERSRERASGPARQSWSRVSCVAVEKAAWEELRRQMEGRILGDPSALPKMQLYSGHVYLGEYPWHSAWLQMQEDHDVGFRVDDIFIPVRPTVTEYVCEQGNYDESIDQTVNVTLPAPWLINLMGLHLSDGRRATFDDAESVRRFFDPSIASAGPQAGLVDRDAFLATLEGEGLTPIWVIAGEKGVYGGAGASFGGRRDFTSVYWLDDGWLKHKRHEEFHAPTRGQLKALLGAPPANWMKMGER